VTDRKRKKVNQDAVSEAIGFVIIFGIMMAGIGLVTLYGYPMLIAEQQNTNIRNMERNMIVLQNDLKSLTYKNVPFKETTLQVAGGALSVQKEPGTGNGLKSSFTIEVPGNGSVTHDLGEIHYDSQDMEATISLENGAVNLIYWDSPDGSVMLSEPRWFYDEQTETFVMSFVTINASDILSQTGIGSVKMKLVDANQTEYRGIAGKVNITYNADPEYNYKKAWKNYFDGPTLDDVMIEDSSAGFNLVYHLDDTAVKNLVIKTYNVTIISL